MKLESPLDTLRVTSPFGQRTDPFGKPSHEFHPGVDFRAAVGDPVYAVKDGRVVRSYLSIDDPAGRWFGYGERILIDHGHGLESSYCHLSRRLVQAGDAVQAGQIIGLAGNTGHSTGPHLHFELKLHGNPCDPMRHFDISPPEEEPHEE